MTSIRDEEEEAVQAAISDKSPVTLGTAILIAGFIVTGLLMFGRLEARVDVIENAQKRDQERLQRMEDKLDRIIDRLSPR